jgi:hypothetical protein
VTKRTAETITVEFRGVPVQVLASYLARRDVYEVTIWMNPDGHGIRDGAPCGQRTIWVRPAQWDAWRAELSSPCPLPRAMLGIAQEAQP